MRIVLDVLRFREDFLPSEDRYEYSLVVALGGELMEIPVSEDQLQNALKEHAHLVGETQAPSDLPQGLQYTPPVEAVEEPTEPSQEGIYIENGMLYQNGQVVPADTRLQLDDGTVVTARAFVEGQGYEPGYAHEVGAVMQAPQMFQDEEDHTFAAEAQEAQDGLEEPLEFDTSGGEGANEMVADLLSEGAGPSMVDEIVVGAEPTTQLPSQEPDMSAVFGEAPEPEQQATVRRDMTPPSRKRVNKIKNQIAKRKNNPHQQKLAEMRARAKRHPMRSGPGADEAGNPIAAPRPRAAIPQAPAHVPGVPTVKHRAPPEPVVEDEDGFPSA